MGHGRTGKMNSWLDIELFAIFIAIAAVIALAILGVLILIGKVVLSVWLRV